MANVINLSPTDSSQVYNVHNVAVLTGEPNTWLLIYSGIANQKLDAQGDSGFLGIGQSTSTTDATVNVTLDNITGVLLQYATMVSPSNILEENTWGQWIIWGSSLSLQDNGDLVLTASTSVTGIGDAEFWSFSYYVSAKVVLDVASISGDIRWLKTLADPVNPPHFSITANSLIAPTGTSFGQFQIVANGTEGSVDSSHGTYYHVPYSITGPLLGKSLIVFVTPNPASFSGVPPLGSLIASQISGPNPVRLTSTNRHAAGVNFEMTFEQGPR
jgi:hypothetical protein